MEEEVGSVASWFANPVYGRYWQHYQLAMSWHQRHRRAYRKALEAAYGPLYQPYQDPGRPVQRYADWYTGEGGGRRQARVRDDEVDSRRGESDEDDSSSEDEIECDVSNMEITDELRQYFAQTEKHREELKKQQQLEADEQGPYVPADRDMHREAWLGSVAPPAERPGERRAAEMKTLYGAAAAKIQGMEAAMQLTFDRNCDRKQPKYWPVIPLKL